MYYIFLYFCANRNIGLIMKSIIDWFCMLHWFQLMLPIFVLRLSMFR